MSRRSTRSQTSSAAAASTQLSAVPETQYELSPIPSSQPGPMRDPPASQNPNEINLVSQRSDSFSTQPMPEEYYIRPVETSQDVFESKEFNRPSQPTLPNWESPPASLLPSISSSSSGGIVSLPPPIEPAIRRVTRAAASHESKSIETVPVIVDPEEKYSPVELGPDEYVIEEIVARYEYRDDDGSSEIFYEIKWKGFPETQNTLEPQDKIPGLNKLQAVFRRKQKEQKRDALRDNWDVTQKTKGPKGDRLREIITSLYNYTNQDIRDMEIYAQTWLDRTELTALQIAREIAKVHHWDWSDQEYTDPVFDLADPEDGEPVENLRDALSQPESLASSEPVELLPSEVLDRLEYKEGKRKDIQKFQEEADDDLKQLFEEELKRVDHLNSVLPNIVIIDLEVHNLEARMISQICVVKLDGSLGFNRYIKRKIKPFLAEEWQFLVENQWVDLDYSDDPDKAVSFPDAILDMCKLFGAGTLFLFKGTTDYFTLVTNFKHHMAPSRADKTVESIREFRSKQYRFSSLDRLLNLAQFPRKLDKRIEPLYNTMFNQSLLINTEIKMLVYSATIRKELSKLFQTEYKLMDPSFKLDRNQEHEKVDIWFWTDGNMQPVFHLAHTDALMTRNVVIALLLYLDLKERFPSEQLLWEQVMTAIVAKTTAFRQYHLGCSNGAANRLWTILEKNKKKFNNSYDLPLDIEVTKPVEVKTRFHREKEFYASEFPSPEREEDELRNVIKSLRAEEQGLDVSGPIYIDEKNPEGKFEVFKDLVIEAVNPQRGNIKKETMHELIWQNKQLLEGKGCRLPKGYLFHRSDLQNFQELQDKRNYNNKPCLLIMHANTQERFPKTYVLHQSKCRHVSYETSNSRNRKSYQQSLSVLDFNEKSEFSYRMRFCKECKMTSAVKSYPHLIRASLLKDQPRVKLEQQQHQPPNNMVPQLFQPVINVNPQIFLPQQQQQNNNRRAGAGVSDALVPPAKPLMGLPFVPSQNLSRYNFRRRGDNL